MIQTTIYRENIPGIFQGNYVISDSLRFGKETAVSSDVLSRVYEN